jgi:thiamine transport system substrate-binding protein
VNRRHVATAVAMLAALTIGVSACGGDEESPTKVVLVTHDAFAVSDDVKAAFERKSGLKLQILKSGDAGAALTTALLTAGNPQGDVFFGVDNNLLSRALDGDLFDPYESPALDGVDKKYVLDPDHRVTPIDHGEVCLNYDKTWFAEHGVAPPRSLDDLTKAPYDGLLVVEDPRTSTPGLAFMLATIARYGEDGWQDYWQKLRERDVLVVDGWEDAYDVRFSGSTGKGSRPIVVSYASSPPAEVIFRTPRPKQAPTAVVEDSCFRQIELAGVLRGARNERGARELIDFMLSKRFQEDMPLTMFVFPVAQGAALPPAFEKYAIVPSDPLDLPPDEIEASRERWLDEWTRIVIR